MADGAPIPATVKPGELHVCPVCGLRGPANTQGWYCYAHRPGAPKAEAQPEPQEQRERERGDRS